MMKRLALTWMGIGLMVCGGAVVAAQSAPARPPSIASLLKPSVYKRVTEEREVMTHASLASAPATPPRKPDPELNLYSFYTAMSVSEPPARTRQVLTDYRLYPKMISYIDSAEFDSKTQILAIRGGIWKFRVASWVHFQEKSERWVHYRIVRGHFAGLEGDLFFEPAGERGTRVLMTGSQEGKTWPPKFVIERGAEIVFGYTAKRMRSYIESNASKEVQPPGDSSDGSVPQPRKRL